MKKILFVLFVFLLFLPIKKTYAATTCVGTTNPDKCDTPKEQSNCCSGSICQQGVMGGQNTCVPAPCNTHNDCPSGFTCTQGVMGTPKTCVYTATTCTNGQDPVMCKKNEDCCEGSTCTPQSMGTSKCVFTATTCVNGRDPTRCDRPGEQSNCCEGKICTENSLTPPTCQASDQKRSNIPLNIPCVPNTNGDGYLCDTGLGFGLQIRTDPAGFVQSIFGILLSISGSIALVLIIISGYQLMVSRANPEKIQAAKERLTSAIIGLLFIILSLVILQVIGVDLLKIPGFN